MTGDIKRNALLAAIEEVAELASTAISIAGDRAALDAVEREYLGPKGRLKDLRRQMGSLDPGDRPEAGRTLQEATARLEAQLAQAKDRGTDDALLHATSFDPTVPGIPSTVGGLHPIVQMMYDLDDAFAALNFDTFAGPEISSERYEFDAMNFPADHPARESMDTYWLAESHGLSGAERLCLRPHLTGASIRYMQTHEPPFRFTYPGRVYRNETTDARHERAFFQYEALIVDRALPFSAGKLLVSTILDTVFGKPVKTRMRVGFFPFVEPGFEIDMECQVCAGQGCSVCKQVGWLEIMPGGVPHPNVLRAAGLSPDEWTGFYINVGLDRLVMMRYGIDDVRLFNGADLRFLSQFK